MFGVWASGPWRDQLEDAIGPVMAWVIPLFLAYIPGLVIGFMIFTLMFYRYRERPAGPPRGDWPEGDWPAVTVVIAAWNEEEAIVGDPGADRRALLPGPGRGRPGRQRLDRPHRALAEEAALRLGLHYRRLFEAEPGKHHALNAVLATVTTPVVVTSTPTRTCSARRSPC